ncbi:matrixin family metalloprotease (plasmid) [Priestia megaterium]|uniref:matrixin family metalloprotease n=1 Tax=Priestia megaterium TaxID=1404 RepID=UPI002067654A|nr:matrixin family metalloprotease [Priestia megaterium]UOO43858.1 matrixin family metalloprotease [Priestia megaterium]
MILSKEFRWENNKIIKVRFIEVKDEEKTMREKVEYYAKQWEEFVNIKFEFIDSGDADIRIGFVSGESQSVIGKGALSNTDQTKTNMNFGSFNSTTPEEEYSSIVLHEFGHALGFRHEHQSPLAHVPWDKPKVLDYFMNELSFCGKAMSKEECEKHIIDNTLKVYSPSEVNYSQFDPSSIMCYKIPAKITNGNFSTPNNTTLSELDKMYASIFYPKKQETIALKVHNGKYVQALNGGGSYLVIKGDVDHIGSWETFEMTSFGNNKVAFKACNGKYWCAEKGGHDFITIEGSENIRSWETFEFIDLGNDKFALKSIRGYYVMPENWAGFGGDLLMATGDGNNPPADWKIFTKIKV